MLTELALGISAFTESVAKPERLRTRPLGER